MHKFQKLSYLLGCYIVVADREINALEVAILDNYIQGELPEDLAAQRQLIFSDDEEKPKLPFLISQLKLSNLTLSQKKEVIRLLADVAFGDDYMASQEKALLLETASELGIDAAPIIQEAENISKERLSSSRLSKTKRLIGKVENYVYSRIPGQKNTDAINLLIGSLGYSTSIENITDNAIVDLDRVTKIIDDINVALKSNLQSLANLKIDKLKSSKEIATVASIVSDINVHFTDLINISLKENREVLEKKNRNIRYFTIAFMGRTKAGKSTLHKVITQQENDDIGVGKLRTKRYNRSWYWNKLRIVDTPGIGAPGGAADTEIAKSIIDEADVICYVVTSDSIQETEFDFFETIKERNKPLYVVLNVKSNLTQSVRLKRFLKNPTAWKDETGPQSLQGHLDRIHERLDGKYNMDSVEIIPIHLLAAQLGFSSDLSSKDLSKLREGSNIFTFTRSIKASVHITGGIKKSLSVVDGSAYQIHSIRASLNKDLTHLKEGRDLLQNKLEKFNKFMTNERKRLISDIKVVFSSTKSELHNRAAAFAQANYDNRDAGTDWKNDSTVKSIYSRMNTRLKQRMDDFNEKLKTQIEEITEDIKVLESFNAHANISGDPITNTRLRAGIVGTIITIASTFAISNIWNPAGWIVGLGTIVVGAIASFFTSLFTSKTEKIRKATEKMRNQLDESIDKNINEYQEKIEHDAIISIDKTINSLNLILHTYINQTWQIIKNIEIASEKCNKGESAINSLVSFRILEFVGKGILKDKDINNIDNKTLIKQYPVVRNWVDQSLTYNYDVSLSAKDKERILKATQMKIIN